MQSINDITNLDDSITRIPDLKQQEIKNSNEIRYIYDNFDDKIDYFNLMFMIYNYNYDYFDENIIILLYILMEGRSREFFSDIESYMSINLNKPYSTLLFRFSECLLKYFKNKNINIDYEPIFNTINIAFSKFIINTQILINGQEFNLLQLKPLFYTCNGNNLIELIPYITYTIVLYNYGNLLGYSLLDAGDPGLNISKLFTTRIKDYYSAKLLEKQIDINKFSENSVLFQTIIQNFTRNEIYELNTHIFQKPALEYIIKQGFIQYPDYIEQTFNQQKNLIQTCDYNQLFKTISSKVCTTIIKFNYVKYIINNIPTLYSTFNLYKLSEFITLYQCNITNSSNVFIEIENEFSYSNKEINNITGSTYDTNKLQSIIVQKDLTINKEIKLNYLLDESNSINIKYCNSLSDSIKNCEQNSILKINQLYDILLPNNKSTIIAPIWTSYLSQELNKKYYIGKIDPLNFDRSKINAEPTVSDDFYCKNEKYIRSIIMNIYLNLYKIKFNEYIAFVDNSIIQDILLLPDLLNIQVIRNIYDQPYEYNTLLGVIVSLLFSFIPNLLIYYLDDPNAYKYINPYNPIQLFCVFQSLISTIYIEYIFILAKYFAWIIQEPNRNYLNNAIDSFNKLKNKTIIFPFRTNTLDSGLVCALGGSELYNSMSIVNPVIRSCIWIKYMIGYNYKYKLLELWALLDTNNQFNLSNAFTGNYISYTDDYISAYNSIISVYAHLQKIAITNKSLIPKNILNMTFKKSNPSYYIPPFQSFIEELKIISSHIPKISINSNPSKSIYTITIKSNKTIEYIGDNIDSFVLNNNKILLNQYEGDIIYSIPVYNAITIEDVLPISFILPSTYRILPLKNITTYYQNSIWIVYEI